MKQSLLTILLVTLCAPALAAGPAPVTSEPLAPLPGGDLLITGEGAPVKEVPVQPSVPVEQGANSPIPGYAVCENYKQIATVNGPAYVAGVDAYGRPVVPADGSAGSQGIDVPERIDLPVSIDLAQAFGVTAPVGTELNAAVGDLTIFKDGRVLYNGTDISNNVAAYCQTGPLKPELNVNVQ